MNKYVQVAEHNFDFDKVILTITSSLQCSNSLCPDFLL